MCKIDKCERHELWGGYCLPHLKEALGVKDATNKKRGGRKKKVDALEVVTTDETEMETREAE